MDPADYYALRLDTDALRALPPEQALSLLDHIRTLATERVVDERARIVARAVAAERARHAPGAKARVAAELGLSQTRVGKLCERAQDKQENQ